MTIFKIRNEKREAELWIYDAIGESSLWFDGISANDIRQELAGMQDVDTISVHINSEGGDVFQGIAMLNLLRDHSATVKVYVDGLAGSIASVVAMAGDEVIMNQSSLFMIHNPWAGTAGDADELRQLADVLDAGREEIISAYQTRVSLDREELRQLMNAETWLGADEAVEMGFASSASSLSVAAFSGIEPTREHWARNYKNAPTARALKTKQEKQEPKSPEKRLSSEAWCRLQRAIV